MVDGPTSPQLVALRTFLAVYRAGAVGKAATVLHLSQPAVSHHVRTLEQLLDRPLFVRDGRGIKATAAAHALASEIEDPVDALARALNSFGSQADGATGPVFLGAPGDILAELIVPEVRDMVADGLTLRCSLGLSHELVDGLLDRRLDVAVVSKVEGAPRKDLHLVRWRTEEFVLVGPADAEPYRTAEDARPFVGYSESMPMTRRYFRSCWDRQPPAPILTVPDMRAVVRAVQAGIGLAVVPAYLVRNELQDGTLDVLHQADQEVTNSLYLATRRGHEVVPRVRAVFMRLLGN